MRRCRDDRGAGLVSTVGGVTAFLAFLLLATQVLVVLHTTSSVVGVAYDGARVVAREQPPIDTATLARAEERMRQSLGGLDARFDWSASTTDEVVLRVSAPAPRVLPPAWGGPGSERITRTVRVRREVPR